MRDSDLKHIIALRIYYRNGHQPMADAKFYDGTYWNGIEWDHVEDQLKVKALMNAYTFIYDERPRREFAKL